MNKCKCGCNGATKRDYIKGHNRRGVQSNWWQGGRTISSSGYVLIWAPQHHRAHHGYVPEHILVMEIALGRDILPTECVHHINQKRWDNYIGNLMLFYSHIVHLAYHRRLKTFEICGHYDWHPCPFCKRYDAPQKLKQNGTGWYHPDCKREYNQEYHRRKKAA